MRLIELGGDPPTAIVELSRDEAAALGHLLYREVDVVARAQTVATGGAGAGGGVEDRLVVLDPDRLVVLDPAAMAKLIGTSHG